MADMTPWGRAIHPHDCGCEECRPYHPADPRPFGWRDAGWFGLAGVAVGNALAFAWDAHGAWTALRSCWPW